MPKCETCSRQVPGGGVCMPCKMCDALHCAAHRLPEDHACPGLAALTTRLRDRLNATLEDGRAVPKKLRRIDEC